MKDTFQKKMRKNKCILILFLICKISLGQSDLNQDQQLIYTNLYSKDFEEAKKIIDSKFLNSSDDSKKVIGYIYLADYYSFFTEKEAEKIDALEKAKSIASNTKKPIDMAYVDFGYARYYEKLNKKEQFIKLINQSIKEFEKHPNENFILTHLYFVRFSHKSKNPLENDLRNDAITSNKYALKSKNNILINFTYSNLGYYYKQQHNKDNNNKYIDSTLNSYKKSYEYSQKIKDPLAKKRSLVVYNLNYGSLITTINPDNSFDETIKYYNKTLELTHNDPKYKEITALTYNNMGSAYENNGDNKLALSYYTKSYLASKGNKDIFPTSRIVILNNLSRVYENLGQLNRALEYEREAKDLIQESNQEQFDNNTKSLEIFYKTEQKNQQIKQLEEKNSIYSKQKFLYIGIALLAIIGTIFLSFMFYYKQKANKQKTDLLEAEKSETKLTLQLELEEKARLKAEQELIALQQEQLQKQALATSLQLNHKTNVINELKEKMKEDKIVHFDRILKDEKLTDGDFNEIQKMVQEVHPNLFKRLNEVSVSKLSNLDLKYAAYLYLDMDNQQIANAMKVESKTVRMAKYRMKQKIGLDKEVDLQTFIRNLDLS